MAGSPGEQPEHTAGRMRSCGSLARDGGGSVKAIRELLVCGEVGPLHQRGRMLLQGVDAGTRETS